MNNREKLPISQNSWTFGEICTTYNVVTELVIYKCCLCERVWDTVLSNGQLVLYVCICSKTGSFMKALYCTFFVRMLLSTMHWIGKSRFIYCKFKFSCKRDTIWSPEKISLSLVVSLWHCTLPHYQFYMKN